MRQRCTGTTWLTSRKKEASLAARGVLVPSDSEEIQPEEHPDRRVVTIDTGLDTRVMSPRSLEGRRAAETLEIEMGRRSVSDSIRPLRDVALGPSTPIAP